MSLRVGGREYLIALMLPLAGFLPAAASAQGVARDFDGLHGRVLLGETVKVVNSDGKATRGRLLKLTDTDLTIQTVDQERTFQGAEIVEVKARRSGPLWNGAVIGAAAVLIPSGIAISKYECDGCFLPVAIWTGIGIAAGVGIDALVKGGRTVIRRAAQPASKGGFTLAPVLQPDRRGVLCSISF